MIDYAAIQVALRLVERGLKVVDNFTDVEQQEARHALKAARRALKKEEIARKIFDGCGDTSIFGDNSFVGTDVILPRGVEENENYWKLRDKWNER